MICCCHPVAIILVLLILFKLYVKLTTGRYYGKEHLDGKTVIVTGANSGIGLVCAKDFAKRGARVIMVCRDMIKADKARMEVIQESGNKDVKLKNIDFTSLSSVRKCANEILSEESRIDVLLNNAGAAGVGYKPTRDGLDFLMQANHFGPFLFTNILLGKIKESTPSRIVNVSSVMHKFSKTDVSLWEGTNMPTLKQANNGNLTRLYSDSKLANIYFANELAEKLKGTGVTANSLHPGAFASGISREAGTIFRFTLNSMLNIFSKTIEESAQTSIYLCVSPDVANVTGKYFADCKLAGVSKKSQDMGIAKKVWELSEKAVSLQDNEKHY